MHCYKCGMKCCTFALKTTLNLFLLCSALISIWSFVASLTFYTGMGLESQEKKKRGKKERERETPDALYMQPVGQIQFQRQGEICEERSPSSRICRPSMYERAFWQTTIIIMFRALPRNFSPCRCKYFSNFWLITI